VIPPNDAKSEHNKSNYDNIILEEDRKKGSLSLKIYSLFFKMNGGPFMALSIFISTINFLTL
jgi:hypothetical protein